MRKKLPIFAMLVAWLVAAGGQWEVLQAFAWVKMFSGYAQTMSLSDSLRATFEPENRCKYCLMAETGKKEQSEQPAVPATDTIAKILLIVQTPADIAFGVPRCQTAPAAENDSGFAWRAAPPTPPPRASVV